MLKSINAFFARTLVALLLVTGTGTALAGPIYRVTVDTSSWSGSGYLNLTLTGFYNAPALTATVSNFKGSFGAVSSTQGQVTGDVGSKVKLVQGPSFNELLQSLDFGGLFSFEVRFDSPAGVPDASNFGVALVNAGLSDYAAGTSGDIAAIGLTPGATDALWADRRFASIAEVPEPGSVALFMLGLLLAAAVALSSPSGRAARHRRG